MTTVGRSTVVLVAVLTLGLLAGCGATTERGHGPMRAMMSGRATAPGWGTGSGSGPMMRPGRMGTHVRSEAHFLTTMVAHHEDAITAAGQLDRSTWPAMRRFGRRIAAVQSAQVTTMRTWLQRWYPHATAASYRPMMGDLSRLDSPALDRVFLRRMIAHHMMAVMMSRMLLRSGLVRHAPVARLARTIITQQTDEIAMMRRWLLHPMP